MYCDVDDFCKALTAYCKAHSLPEDKKRVWFPAIRLSLSEVMTIILLFHLSGYRCFKRYYQRYGYLPLLTFFSEPEYIQPQSVQTLCRPGEKLYRMVLRVHIASDYQ
jgi:hypothetical protein